MSNIWPYLSLADGKVLGHEQDGERLTGGVGVWGTSRQHLAILPWLALPGAAEGSMPIAPPRKLSRFRIHILERLFAPKEITHPGKTADKGCPMECGAPSSGAAAFADQRRIPSRSIKDL
jgi:hypothetical protein